MGRKIEEEKVAAEILSGTCYVTEKEKEKEKETDPST
jgi:hypothetical protein